MKIIESSKSKSVDFAELRTGACFKDEDGDLMMKLDEQQKAVDLSDGCTYGGMCGDQVTPTNAEVHIIN